MWSMRQVGLFILNVCFCFTAAGQVNDAALRAAFGQPVPGSVLHVKIFKVAPGLQMTVRFGSRGQACQIEIPPGVANTDEVHRILEKAVPLVARGKKWNQFLAFMGLAGFSNTYYENVIFTEDVFASWSREKNPGATVVFKDKDCGWKDTQDELDRPARGNVTQGK